MEWCEVRMGTGSDNFWRVPGRCHRNPRVKSGWLKGRDEMWVHEVMVWCLEVVAAKKHTHNLVHCLPLFALQMKGWFLTDCHLPMKKSSVAFIPDTKGVLPVALALRFAMRGRIGNLWVSTVFTNWLLPCLFFIQKDFRCVHARLLQFNNMHV